mmetsp:Transcript_1455/g.1277  ORF Transcript_1455/g.1277 Transcript_1455/m.1277 type:complete len:111 (+) Transcript_1455:77-409(+)
MNQKEQEVKRMESVMNESKNGFYERNPASPEHNKMKRTGASTSFQYSPTRSNEKDTFEKAILPKEIKETVKKESSKEVVQPKEEILQEDSEEVIKEIDQEDMKEDIEEEE